ncbi:DUF4349 domain-containing protein [Kineococcus aurantiacus]|uniref:DUF4349 domain-containing protein n=1 Tax=Kineococcus aurantiacus TaxID=37633 RepID=A0A7Y9AVE0_9ACTN|nr:DUF4349 domain-containing protein [Kineococcus aurantiacus]NYD21255.1 hypothetical protein [Kineococcus aurantiacus]
MRSPDPAPRRTRHRRAAAATLALTLLLGVPALAACSGAGAGSSESSGSGSSGSGSAADAGSVAAPAEGPAGPADPATGTGAAAGTGTADAAAPDRAVVSTATIAVRVRDLPAAVADVEARTTAAGGLVSASRSGGTDGAQSAHLTLRVPSPAFEDLLDGVAGLGQQTDRTTASTDVTAEVADVGSRVTSARAVLDTFRQRLPQATTVPDVLAIEGEIARRQADLEALEARQRVLADQVSLATVDVDLTRGAPLAATAAAQPGFRGGLAAGWHALGEAGRVLALVAGAVLPFLVPVALVAVPAWLLVRRRRTRQATPAAE